MERGSRAALPSPPPCFEGKGCFSAAASAARAMQLSRHPCFVGGEEGSKPGEPPAPNPTSKETSGKPFQSPRKRKKMLAWAGVPHCQGFSLPRLPAVGKGWKENILGNPGEASWG